MREVLVFLVVLVAVVAGVWAIAALLTPLPGWPRLAVGFLIGVVGGVWGWVIVRVLCALLDLGRGRGR